MCFQELGVYYGATLRSTATHLAAQGFPSRQVYGFDSFQGLVEDWSDLFPGIWFQHWGAAAHGPSSECQVGRGMVAKLCAIDCVIIVAFVAGNSAGPT